VGGDIRKEGFRNGGNGYKNAISVVWSIAITSVPSFRRSVTRSLGNHNPKTLLRPGDGWAAGGRQTRRGGSGSLMDTYWYHLYTLKSFPLYRFVARADRSRACIILRKKRHCAARERLQNNLSCPETGCVNSSRNANTCAANQCLPRSDKTICAYISFCFGQAWGIPLFYKAIWCIKYIYIYIERETISEISWLIKDVILSQILF